MNTGRWILVFALLIVGCIDTTVDAPSSCNGESDQNKSAFDVGNGGNGGSAGFGGNGAAPLLADGSPCDFDSQCENTKCIPSKNSFGIGVCYSHAVDGCIVVTAPSPFKESCLSLSRRLYVCGDSYPIPLLGISCVLVGTGDIGEDYHCCPYPP